LHSLLFGIGSIASEAFPESCRFFAKTALVREFNAAATLAGIRLHVTVGGCVDAGAVSTCDWKQGIVTPHFYKEIDVHVLATINNGLFLEYFSWLVDLLVSAQVLRQM